MSELLLAHRWVSPSLNPTYNSISPRNSISWPEKYTVGMHVYQRASWLGKAELEVVQEIDYEN